MHELSQCAAPTPHPPHIPPPHTETVLAYDVRHGRANWMILPVFYEQFIAHGIVHGGKTNNTVPPIEAVTFKRRKSGFYIQTCMLMSLVTCRKRPGDE